MPFDPLEVPFGGARVMWWSDTLKRKNTAKQAHENKASTYTELGPALGHARHASRAWQLEGQYELVAGMSPVAQCLRRSGRAPPSKSHARLKARANKVSRGVVHSNCAVL
ncbi:hypothetical protein HaLaN_06276 [Haematococcus lacustris]|uniref:Uncharacterized protein n=1 Tax=Haematococcus lacustris TaxID=44745 RepID=A0A699YWJ6_HAELA|nr:hypothetical protein HaLaN_06276 [Haematococcus lacustris]